MEKVESFVNYILNRNSLLSIIINNNKNIKTNTYYLKNF